MTIQASVQLLWHCNTSPQNSSALISFPSPNSLTLTFVLSFSPLQHILSGWKSLLTAALRLLSLDLHYLLIIYIVWLQPLTIAAFLVGVTKFFIFPRLVQIKFCSLVVWTHQARLRGTNKLSSIELFLCTFFVSAEANRAYPNKSCQPQMRWTRALSKYVTFHKILGTTALTH